MSQLGDLIVEHGPYDVGESLPGNVLFAPDLNALRDELIELRALRLPVPQECREETHSWQHFTPEQADSYWIRCTLLGPHDEHEDTNTGLTWVSQADPNSGPIPGGERDA